MVELTEDFEANLRAIADIQGSGLSAERLILKEGYLLLSREPFTYEELGAISSLLKWSAFKSYRKRECFRNAAELAIVGEGLGFDYAEGFGQSPDVLMPIHHAIVTINLKPVDVTWRADGERGLFDRIIRNQVANQYYVMMFDREYVTRIAIQDRAYSGVLYGYVRSRIEEARARVIKPEANLAFSEKGTGE